MLRAARHIVINIVLAFVWVFFAYENLRAFFVSQELSLLLFVILQTEFVIFLLLRKPPSKVSVNPFDYAVAIAGSFMPLFFLPVLNSGIAINVTSSICIALAHAGDWLIYLAVALEILGFMALNTSTGIIPANRGIKTGGLYRFVRHPVYASYLLLYLGYVMNNPSSYNMAILILALCLQVARIYREESLLMQDPEYRKYAEAVKWRAIPGIF